MIWIDHFHHLVLCIEKMVLVFFLLVYHADYVLRLDSFSCHCSHSLLFGLGILLIFHNSQLFSIMLRRENFLQILNLLVCVIDLVYHLNTVVKVIDWDLAEDSMATVLNIKISNCISWNFFIFWIIFFLLLNLLTFRISLASLLFFFFNLNDLSAWRATFWIKIWVNVNTICWRTETHHVFVGNLYFLNVFFIILRCINYAKWIKNMLITFHFWNFVHLFMRVLFF